MKDGQLTRAGMRVAAAVVRRARRYRERLFAPDAFADQVAAVARVVADIDLSQSVVAITGSSRGVGLALAKALAGAGARVVLNGRDAGRLQRAAGEFGPNAGERVLTVAADVSTPEGARRLVADTVARFGRIDVLVNNAAVAGPVNTPPWQIDPAAWDPVLAANVRGPFLCAREAMGWMTAHGSAGRIVNVSSGAGRAAAPGMAPYVASKFALEGLTRALAMDADGTGIVVCALELGQLRTDLSRTIVRFEDHEFLPPPETAVPAFLHAITGPADQVAGKVFAAWRHEQDTVAEAQLARPLAGFPKFNFAPLKFQGRDLRRTDPGIQAFDRAENPVGMPRGAREAIQRCLDGGFDASRYPDERCLKLRAALSERFQLPPQDFTFAPGSAELVERIVRSFAGCGEDVIANDPTWFMFDRFCALAEVPLRRIPVRQRTADGPFDHNLEAIAKAILPRTRLIYLINPSNPLGNGIDHDEFVEFLKQVPPHIPVVVDEAYVEFHDDPKVLRTHELVRSTDRMLIALRTFSKFYGLANLRIGYAFGVPRAIRLLERLEHLFCVPTLVEEAAVGALADTEHARATHDLLRVEKARIRARLASAGLASLPSQAHFMLVEFPVSLAEADRVWDAFLTAGSLTPRGVMFDRYMMLPVLKPAQNDRHLDILIDAATQWRASAAPRAPEAA